MKVFVFGLICALSFAETFAAYADASASASAAAMGGSSSMASADAAAQSHGGAHMYPSFYPSVGSGGCPSGHCGSMGSSYLRPSYSYHQGPSYGYQAPGTCPTCTHNTYAKPIPAPAVPCRTCSHGGSYPYYGGHGGNWGSSMSYVSGHTSINGMSNSHSLSSINNNGHITTWLAHSG